MMTQKSRKLFILCSFFCFLCSGYAQDIALKTNALYWGALTPNIGIEARHSRKLSTDWQVAYNPWTFKDDKKLRFWLVQPELRYWFCEAMEGHFVGLHLHGAQFYGSFNEKRYDGYLVGGGLTYGYAWILSSHWNLEALIGVGYARLWYKESPHIPCNKCYERKTRDYVGPTKLALSISYIF